MTFNEFKQSLSNDTPPHFDNVLLKALWHDGKGNWEASHNVAQEVETSEGSWVHAYLHRKEGDAGNASYWYHRAKRKMPTFSLDEEWEQIVKELLQS
jgi:hypothetical protein